MSDEIEWPPFLQEPVDKGATTTLGMTTPKSGYPRWVVRGSSEVVLMARRLFRDHISKKADTISTPAIRESFEDVLMLRHRYPIRLSSSAKTFWNSWFADLRNAWLEANGLAEKSEANLAAWFTGQLEPFQAEGVRFLTSKRKVILADEMGLGKTVQALAAAAQVGTWPVLIVAQPHVVSHWERKAQEFLKSGEDGLKIHTLEGQGPKGRAVPKADIYITHYLLLRYWRDWLTRREWGAIIADEVQELRGVTSEKHGAFQAVARKTPNVWGLSGTPIYNKGVEVHHIYDAMAPGIFGPRKAFVEDWCTPTDWEEADAIGWRPGYAVDPQALGQYLRDRGLLLRRLEDQVKGELPPLRRFTRALEHDDALFNSLIKEAARLARKAVGTEGEWQKKSLEAQALAQARKATGVAKASASAAFVRACVDSGQPCIVFAHHHAVVDLIKGQLADLSPVCITGRQTRQQKAKAQRDFENGLTDVCIIGLRAATGLDGLQKRARTVLFAELDWSPAIHQQGEKRAHRWGQRNEVICYYLVAQNLFDADMLDYLKAKIIQSGRILHDEEVTPEQMAADEKAASQHMQRMLDHLRRIN
jgi:SNF2 family DNA or RNA helicase